MKTLGIILLTLFCISATAQQGVYMEYKYGVEGKEISASVLKIFSYKGDTYSERTLLKYPQSPERTLNLKKKKDNLYFIHPNKTYFVFPDHQLHEYRVK